MDESPFTWVEEYSFTPYKRKAKSKKLEFIGWGSRPLIEYLDSIGKDTSQVISRHDATAIITRYVNENNLVHPLKKKRINCDERLHALFGRKSIARNKIHALLDPHYADSLENSDDELLCSSEDDIDTNFEQHKSSGSKTPPKKRVLEANRSCFAAIVPDNVKLVYLKRSLVTDLLNDPETFERKVLGSYVRIKSDPHDYLQKNSHCLMQVKGIKKVPGADGTSTEILFHVSNFIKDVPISFLSDENFSEEECEDLHQRIKDGLLKKPTVVELEEKAQFLHEDLTKHWIVRELALLQKLIDRANEKGWRRELFEYLDRRHLLQTPAEQSRLLQEVPKVIADTIEQEVPLHDNPDGIKQGNYSSQLPILKETSEIPICDIAANDTSCFVSRNTEFTVALPQSKQQTEQGIQAAMPMPKLRTLPRIQADLLVSKQPKELGIQADLLVSKQPKELEIQVDLPISKQQVGSETQAGLLNSKRQIEEENLLNFPLEQRQRLPIEIASESSNVAPQPMRNNEENKVPEVIHLSDDDDDEENEYPSEIDGESYEWHYVDPQGDIQGPFAITSLKRWSDADYFPPDFKVWKTGQGQDEAVLLTDLLEWAYPNH